ncbi:MAG: hypothetical protein KF893_19880 [Caldilineaceae bacterium]|nr:hypothetical protein [Caldilineaceae bacterium]
MTTTIRVKGIYNGKTIELLEPVTIAPDTEVEILIPELQSQAAKEQEFLTQLLERGLITHIPTGKPRDAHFQPVRVQGKPVSETIIEERR